MKRAVVDIETIPVARLAEATGEETKKLSLSPLTGKIVCIGVMLVDNFAVSDAVAIVSDDERELLVSFWDYLRQHGTSRFIAHNGLAFDLPFIWNRCVINRVKPGFEFDLRKFRRDFVFDTMAVWSNWDIRSSPKLGALGEALSLGSKSASGDEVLALWEAGKLSDLASYCLRDCWLTYGCYCRMHFVEPIQEADVPQEQRILGGTSGNCMPTIQPPSSTEMPTLQSA